MSLLSAAAASAKQTAVEAPLKSAVAGGSIFKRTRDPPAAAKECSIFSRSLQKRTVPVSASAPPVPAQATVSAMQCEAPAGSGPAPDIAMNITPPPAEPGVPIAASSTLAGSSVLAASESARTPHTGAAVSALASPGTSPSCTLKRKASQALASELLTPSKAAHLEAAHASIEPPLSAASTESLMPAHVAEQGPSQHMQLHRALDGSSGQRVVPPVEQEGTRQSCLDAYVYDRQAELPDRRKELTDLNDKLQQVSSSSILCICLLVPF